MEARNEEALKKCREEQWSKRAADYIQEVYAKYRLEREKKNQEEMRPINAKALSERVRNQSEEELHPLRKEGKVSQSFESYCTYKQAQIVKMNIAKHLKEQEEVSAEHLEAIGMNPEEIQREKAKAADRRSYCLKVATETPFQRLMRLRKTKINVAVFNLRQKLKMAGVPAEEIELKASELRKTMKAEPLSIPDQVSTYVPRKYHTLARNEGCCITSSEEFPQMTVEETRTRREYLSGAERRSYQNRFRILTETPEQRVIRLRKQRINQAAHNLRVKLKAEGVFPEEIEAKVKELRETMEAEPLPPIEEVSKYSPKWGKRKYIQESKSTPEQVGIEEEGTEPGRAFKIIPKEMRKHWSAAEKKSYRIKLRLLTETPEQRVIRLKKQRIIQAVHQLRAKLKSEGISQEEIEAKVEELRKTMEAEPLPPTEQVSSYIPKLGKRKYIHEGKEVFLKKKTRLKMESVRRRREENIRRSTQHRQAKLQSMTEEEKAEHYRKLWEREKKRLQRMTEVERDMDRKRKSLRRQARLAEMTEEEWEARNRRIAEQKREWRRSMTGERRKRYEEYMRKKSKEYRQRATARTRAAKVKPKSSDKLEGPLDCLKTRYTTESPEARQRRLHRYRIRSAVNLLKSKLGKSGASEEEIEREVAELRERMKADPLPPLDQISTYVPRPWHTRPSKGKRGGRSQDEDDQVKKEISNQKRNPDADSLTSRKTKAEIMCPFCLSIRMVTIFLGYSKHLQTCAKTTTLSITELKCSLCKVWSCPYSTDIREFLEHIVPCREKYEGNPIPWRHSVLKCGLCLDSNYIPFPEFALHIFRFHQHRFGCTQCPVRRKTYTGIFQHFRVQHKSLWDKTVARERYTSIPEGSNVPLPSIPWWCPSPQCYQEFPDEDSRDVHMSNCQDHCKQERNKSCSLCDRKYFSEEELLMHRVIVHGQFGASQWECTLCRKVFSHQGALKLHMKSHSGSGVKSRVRQTQTRKNWNYVRAPSCCEHCGKIVATKPSLRDHIARAHGIGGFKCDVEGCAKVFAKMESLENHRRYKHEGVQKPKRCFCQFCGKGFGNSTHLKRHEETIHQGTPFKCNLCEKTFSSKPNVFYHVTYTHKLKGEDRISAFTKLDLDEASPKE